MNCLLHHWLVNNTSNGRCLTRVTGEHDTGICKFSSAAEVYNISAWARTVRQDCLLRCIDCASHCIKAKALFRNMCRRLTRIGRHGQYMFVPTYFVYNGLDAIEVTSR
ncbi:TPA: hypothetical protein ACH3X2_008575 [Trebouxia sp. C0005]